MTETRKGTNQVWMCEEVRSTNKNKQSLSRGRNRDGKKKHQKEETVRQDKTENMNQYIIIFILFIYSLNCVSPLNCLTSDLKLDIKYFINISKMWIGSLRLNF